MILRMSELATLEVPVAGMDCAECTQHVRHAIAALPGVASVDVFLASEKALVLQWAPSMVRKSTSVLSAPAGKYRLAITVSTEKGKIVEILREQKRGALYESMLSEMKAKAKIVIPK